MSVARFGKSFTPPRARSITLPDGIQQFMSDKLINVTQTGAQLDVEIGIISAGVSAPLSYTASSIYTASLLFQAIITAATTGQVGDIVLAEQTAPITGVTIVSSTPGSIGSFATGVVEPVTIVGTGFLTLTEPLFVAVIYPGGGGGPIYNFFTDIVVVDDVTITCNSVSLAVGSWDLWLAGPDWAATIPVTVA